jgi:hypothetical protein
VPNSSSTIIFPTKMRKSRGRMVHPNKTGEYRFQWTEWQKPEECKRQEISSMAGSY